MWRDKTKWFGVAAAMVLCGTGIAVGRLYADRVAYDNGQQANSGKIDATSNKAKKFDKDWKEIENSGADDRLQITNTMALMADRDIAIDVSQAIARAFEPQRGASIAAEMRKPRDQRRVVELISWNMKYEADISQHVTADAAGHFMTRDDEFNPLADKLEMMPGSNSTGEGRTSYDRAGSNKQAVGPVMRGFLVTLLCRTPFQDPTRVVQETVVAELRKPQLLPNGDPVPSFSIERVTIPSKIKVAAAYPTGILRPSKPPLDFQRPVQAGNPQAGAGQAAPAPPAVAEDPFSDPMHKGESMANDSLVTLLVAVVIDPERKDKTPAASSSKSVGPKQPKTPGMN
jgi:hypothetical protein